MPAGCMLMCKAHAACAASPHVLTTCPAPFVSPSTPGAFNDWNKDRQFQKLNAQKDIIEVRTCGAWRMTAG